MPGGNIIGGAAAAAVNKSVDDCDAEFSLTLGKGINVWFKYSVVIFLSPFESYKSKLEEEKTFLNLN